MNLEDFKSKAREEIADGNYYSFTELIEEMGGSIVHDKPIDQSRWDVLYECVFTFGDDNFFMTTRKEPATENQDHDEYDLIDEVNSTVIVRPQPVTVIEYVGVP